MSTLMPDNIRFSLGGVTVEVAVGVSFLNVLANPSLYDYPDASNTGIAGVGLTDDDLIAVGSIDVNNADVRENGAVRATRPGSGSTTWGPVTLFPDRTEILRAHIQTQVRQRSAYLLEVAESKITASGVESANFAVDTRGKKNWDAARTVLTDCTVWGGLNDQTVAGGLFTLLRCDVSGGEDAIRPGSGSLVEDCYVHDLGGVPGGHEDIIQIIVGSWSTIRHCTLLAAQSKEPGAPGAMEFLDGWYDPHNAVGMIGNENGATTNITFEDCLADGGNLTFNSNWGNQVNLAENITVRRCRFGRHFRYGPKETGNANTDPNPPTWIWEDNVWDDTGEPA